MRTNYSVVVLTGGMRKPHLMQQKLDDVICKWEILGFFSFWFFFCVAIYFVLSAFKGFKCLVSCQMLERNHADFHQISSGRNNYRS